jgi:hypothetical protein
VCIRRRVGGCGVMVSPCGREMGAGGGSIRDAGWERDRAREMRCGHRARELCLDAGLG